LTVYFCSSSVVCEKVVIHAIEMSLLLARGSVCIVVFVLDLFSSRKLVVREQLCDGNSRGICL
jgi:hypothetical protein